MVTNLDKPKCAGAQAAYKEGVVYAIKKLAALNVHMYIDAGHAGWLGWPANLTPAAQLFVQIYKDAGSPRALRGLSTSKYPVDTPRGSKFTDGNSKQMLPTTMPFALLLPIPSLPPTLTTMRSTTSKLSPLP